MTSRIRLGPLTVQYLAAGESLLEPVGSVSGFDEDDDRALRESTSIRRILMSLPGGQRVYLLLHWSDQTDLATLDERVAAKADCAALFKGAVPGSIMTVRCPACLAIFRAAVADPGVPLFEDPSTRLRSHSYVSRCPQCGHEMQPHVMEIVREPGASQ